jgi:hypothetical protein
MVSIGRDDRMGGCGQRALLPRGVELAATDAGTDATSGSLAAGRYR